ncbi:MAG: alkene reductase [Sandaracinaceae bacterium]
MSNPSSPLFDPTRLGAIALPNRIVMAPMTRSRATPDGIPSPLAARYYAQRASAGLILTEGTQPSYQGQGYCRTPGIHTDGQVAGWRVITDAVHDAGGKIALQVMHVGRVGHAANQFEQVGFVAPSALAADAQMYTDAEGMQPMALPREMTLADVAEATAQHRAATERAFEAGFDGVELHAANGYLGQQFLSSGTNQRTDAYGGSAEARARWVVETLEAMASVDGPERVGVRLSPGGVLNDVTDADPSATYAALLKAIGGLQLAWVHFMHTGWEQETLYGQVQAPLILTGGYDREKAEAALAETGAAAIGFGRPFLANPDLPARLRHGHPLNEPDGATFFTPGEKGYIDYPALGEDGPG